MIISNMLRWSCSTCNATVLQPIQFMPKVKYKEILDARGQLPNMLKVSDSIL